MLGLANGELRRFGSVLRPPAPRRYILRADAPWEPNPTYIINDVAEIRYVSTSACPLGNRRVSMQHVINEQWCLRWTVK